MSQHRKFPKSNAAIVFALLTFAFLSSSCSKDHKTDQTAPQPAREVQATLPQWRNMERILAVTGSLVPREQANVSVKVAGRLKTLSVDIGSPVKKGDVIGQVDPRDYELRLQLAQAALAEARAALGLALDDENSNIDPEKVPTVRETKAVLEQAKKNRERILNLQKEGVASRAELDTAEAAFKVAREKYEAAFDEVRGRQAALAQRQAEVDLAKQQLSDTNVRAPFDGIIQARIANMGEYVPAGAQVVALVQVDPLRLRLEISERSAAQVKLGQKVRLVVDGIDETFSGTISRVSPAISEQNRMLIIEADVPNPGKLRPGQFVRAEIIVNPEEKGLAVPSNALVVFAGLEKLVVIENGEAVEKNVKTGRRGADWIEITTGLKENEKVILNATGLRTGQPVTVKAGNVAAAQSSAK